MAKRYDTQEDFTRDIIDDQVQRMDRKADAQNNAGWAALATGMLVDTFIDKKNSLLRFVSTALMAFAAVEWVSSWFTRSKAHDLKLQRERLGPAEVVLPAGVTPMEEKDCSKGKSYSTALAPKTLAQYAEKPSAEQPLGKL